jgi:hypothetical protein
MHLLPIRLDLQLPVQSVPITTQVVSSNLIHGEVYSIQYYVIKFVSDLRQVGGFLQVLRTSGFQCPSVYRQIRYTAKLPTAQKVAV